MSIRYKPDHTALASILSGAADNATYLIPDLQRPYVWTPMQVIRLVDSLFRGWPFGSLLLWEVDSAAYGRDEGIPHREFWKIVDRTDGKAAITSTKREHPASYRMVLDGQQRVQSLLLALGGDAWGIQMYDHEWANALGLNRMRAGEHWSKGSLCLDLEHFEAEWREKKEEVRRIDVENVLAWVVVDQSGNGQSSKKKPANYNEPLLKLGDHIGRFIRLSRLWEVVESGLPESAYRDTVSRMCQEYGTADEVAERLRQPLAEFLKIIEQIKAHSFVDSLLIETFRPSALWTKDDYDTAIVNIFTRLNTAGRTLTQEEITLAWLKVGWDNEQTGGRTAGHCIQELREKLSGIGREPTVDEVVRLLGFLWAIESDTREGRLLDARDLLKGEVLRPMARYLSEHWHDIVNRLEEAAQITNGRRLNEVETSFNAVIVSWSVFCSTAGWLARRALRVTRDDECRKQLDDLYIGFVDRWILASQWSGIWAERAGKNLERAAQILYSGFSRAYAADLPSRSIELIAGTLDDLMAVVSHEAIAYVNNLSVRDAKRVSQYKPVLWIWHRLAPERWRVSQITMRTLTRRGTPAVPYLEVDHTVAFKEWERMIDAVLMTREDGQSSTGSERTVLVGGEEVAEWTARALVNGLGNCTLLQKSFNISKSDGSLWGFLKDVHEVRNTGELDRAMVEAALDLDPIMTEPTVGSVGEVAEAISRRDKRIREEVVRFIRGEKARVDV